MGLKERREREKQARREQILNAARELLHEKGIHAASMNQIAKKAELGVATLYSYFKNKEDLFIALQQEGLDLLKSHLMKVLDHQADPRIKLRDMAWAFLEFSQQQKKFYYIINYFISNPEILFEPQLKDLVDLRAQKTLSVVETVIRKGIEQGVFKPIDSMRCTIMFWGLIHSLTLYKKLESTILRNDNHTEIYRFAVQHFIDSISQDPA